MTDFSVGQDLSTPSAPAAVGGSSPSNAGAGVAVGAVAQVASIFAQEARRGVSSGVAEARFLQEQQQDAIVGRVLNAQGEIAAAVSSGQMSSAEGTARTLAVGREAMAATPGAAEDISKAMAGFSKGIGSVILEGTEKERSQKKLFERAQTNGFVNPFAPRDVQAAQLDLMIKQETRANQLKAVAAERAEIIGKSNERVTLDSNDLKLLQNHEARLDMEATTLYQQLSEGNSQRHSSSIQAVLDNPEADPVATQTALEGLKVQWEDEIRNGSPNVDQTEIENSIKVMNSKVDLALRMSNKEIAAEVYKKEVAFIAAEGTVALGRTPAGRNWLVLQEMRVTDAMALVPDATNMALDMFESLTEELPPRTPPPPVINAVGTPGAEASKVVLSGLEDSMVASQKGELSEIGMEQTLKGVQNTLLSIGNENMSTSDVENFTPVMKWLGSVKGGKYIVDNWDALGDSANAADNLVTQTFTKQLLPMLRENIDVSLGTRAHFGSTGVTFDSSLFTEKNKLNREVAPILNTWIRAQAHVSGTTDYQKHWEEVIRPMVFADQVEVDERVVGNILRTVSNPSAGDIIGGFQFLGGDKLDRTNYARPTGRNKGELGTPIAQEAATGEPFVETVEIDDFSIDGVDF